MTEKKISTKITRMIKVTKNQEITADFSIQPIYNFDSVSNV